jgi:hypothetical protein
MIHLRCSYAAILALALPISGCGTPKEKTAPCKRPADLSSFVPMSLRECGPALPVNADPAVVLAAMNAIQSQAVGRGR